jgi:hypothetical protein
MMKATMVKNLQKPPLSYEWLGADRRNEFYDYLFKIEDKLYQAHGDYDSQCGVEFTHYEAAQLYEVKPVEKTITVYERVN